MHELRLILARLLLPAAIGLTFAACTNYTAEEQLVNPPIILDITAEGTGHIITVAAQNSEIGFFTYRLFQGTSEADVFTQNPLGGTDCGPLALLPDTATNYIIEVKPGQSTVTAGASGLRLCSIPATLSSGEVIAIRAVIFNITSVQTSIPSNVFTVP